MDLKSLLFSFQGRIGRAQWWLGSLGVIVVFGAIMGGSVAAFGIPEGDGNYSFTPPGVVILLVAAALYIWALFALQAKRWHDRDKSAWWILIGLVPVIGGLWALIENGFLSGTVGTNRFGNDPLA